MFDQKSKPRFCDRVHDCHPVLALRFQSVLVDNNVSDIKRSLVGDIGVTLQNSSKYEGIDVRDRFFVLEHTIWRINARIYA